MERSTFAHNLRTNMNESDVRELLRRFADSQESDEEEKDGPTMHGLFSALLSGAGDKTKRVCDASRYFLKKQYPTLNPKEFKLCETPTKPDEEFLCPICKELIFNPVSICEDSHTVCNECARKHTLKSPKGFACPMCKQPLTPFQRNNALRHKLETTLTFVCKSPQCFHVGTLEELKKHLATCTFVTHACTNKGCEEQGSVAWKAEHALVCTFRMTKCECGTLFQVSEEKKHQDECLMTVVECDHDECTVKDTRKSMFRHKHICPKRIVVCHLCGEKYMNELMRQHNQTNLAEHVLYLTRSTCKTLMRIGTDLDIKVFGTTMNIGLMEKRATDMYYLVVRFKTSQLHARGSFMGRGALEGYRCDMKLSSKLSEVPFIPVRDFPEEAMEISFVECHLTLA